MSVLGPGMAAALAGPNPTIFGAVEIVLPEKTIRLLDGAGIIAFDGKTFTGQDATYGAIHSVDDLTDGTGDEAPAVTLTIAPASDAAAADLSAANHQGSPVTMWLGVVDQSNGLVIGEPYLEFLGELDVPTLKAGKNSRLLDIEVTSVFEEFFTNDDGVRLSDASHQAIWPNETGLSEATGVLHQDYWGSAPPSGVST